MSDEKPHGGPQSYYDFDKSWVTFNDVAEWLAMNRWGSNAVQLFNIFKACFRWGEKNGTTKIYDAKKIIYYGFRLYITLTSKEEGRKYLQELLDDKQFQSDKTERELLEEYKNEARNLVNVDLEYVREILKDKL